MRERRRHPLPLGQRGTTPVSCGTIRPAATNGRPRQRDGAGRQGEGLRMGRFRPSRQELDEFVARLEARRDRLAPRLQRRHSTGRRIASGLPPRRGPIAARTRKSPRRSTGVPDMDPGDLLLILESLLRPPGWDRHFLLHPLRPGIHAPDELFVAELLRALHAAQLEALIVDRCGCGARHSPATDAPLAAPGAKGMAPKTRTAPQLRRRPGGAEGARTRVNRCGGGAKRSRRNPRGTESPLRRRRRRGGAPQARRPAPPARTRQGGRKRGRRRDCLATPPVELKGLEPSTSRVRF